MAFVSAPARTAIGAFDVLVIAGLVLSPFFGWHGLRVAEVGFLPLLALPFMWARARPERRDWILLLLYGQYAVLITLNYWLYPPLDDTPAPRADRTVLYLGTILLLFLTLVRLRQSFSLASIWRFTAPAALVLCFGLLGWEYVYARPETCRIGLLTKDLMIPPPWIGVFSVGLFHGWRRMGRTERWLRYGLVAVAVLAMTAFLGSRGGLLAIAAGLGCLSLVLGRGLPARQRVGIVVALGCAGLLGLLAGLAVSAQAGCPYSDRLGAVFLTLANRFDADEITRTVRHDQLQPDSADVVASTAAEPPEAEKPAEQQLTERRAAREEQRVASVYIRAVLWQDGLEAFRKAPVFGYGIANERALTPGDFPHFHQQYISWLVWGGLILLASGVVLMLTPLATFGVRSNLDGAILAVALIVPPSVYFLIETFLNHSTTILTFPVVLGLFHVMTGPEPEGAPVASPRS